ncbi:MAG: hypothetical protein ACKOYP_11000 [Bacteroidota bacterium]
MQRTSASEAIRYLGQPTYRENFSNPDGNFEVLGFGNIKLSIFGSSVQGMMLEFREGRLSSRVDFNVSKKEGVYFNTAALDKIRIGITTKEEVLKLFGEPKMIITCPTSLEDFKHDCGIGSETLGWYDKPEGEKLSTLTQTMMTFSPDGKVIGLDRCRD